MHLGTANGNEVFGNVDFGSMLFETLLDYSRHLDYIHYNPVKHGYVKSPAEWQYSSIHRYINTGILPRDWAYHNESTDQPFGE